MDILCIIYILNIQMIKSIERHIEQLTIQTIFMAAQLAECNHWASAFSNEKLKSAGTDTNVRR